MNKSSLADERVQWVVINIARCALVASLYLIDTIDYFKRINSVSCSATFSSCGAVSFTGISLHLHASKTSFLGAYTLKQYQYKGLRVIW